MALLSDKYHTVWTKEDTLISFFVYKYGERAIKEITGEMDTEYGLEYIANYYIGSTGDSLSMQMELLRSIDNPIDGKLNHTSKIQRLVHEIHSDTTYGDLSQMVNEILDTIDTEKVYQEFSKIFKRILEEKTEKCILKNKEIEKSNFDQMKAEHSRVQDKNLQVLMGSRKLKPIGRRLISK